MKTWYAVDRNGDPISRHRLGSRAYAIAARLTQVDPTDPITITMYQQDRGYRAHQIVFPHSGSMGWNWK